MFDKSVSTDGRFNIFTYDYYVLLRYGTVRTYGLADQIVQNSLPKMACSKLEKWLLKSEYEDGVSECLSGG